MNRHGPRRKGLPAAQCLTVNDVLFINEYMANGRNGTQAYLKVHPNVTPESARASAPGVLAKLSVQEEIARQVRAGGITKETIMSDLVYARDLAHKALDYSALASISLDCAKLAGFLVEKHQVEDISASEMKAMRDLVRDHLNTPATN